MRVAHLLRKYDPAEWGGTETAIHRLTSGLVGHGVGSVVYAPRLSRPGGTDPLAEAGCAVRRFRACAPVWGLSDERKRQMVAVGGNLVSFDLGASLWRERGIDLVHSHTLGRLGAIGRTVARCRRLPFVVSIHGGVYDLPEAVRRDLHQPAGGWDWGKAVGFLLRARSLLAAADAIVTVNPREAALLRAQHPDRRVLVQPHGIPASLYAPDQRAAARRAFPWLAGRSVLLMPGRIDPVKNQDWVLGQVPELVRRHPSVLVVAVGPCTHRDYGDAVRARLDREGLREHVRLEGPLPPGDPRLIGLLQEAAAVVLPSLSETFGLVILEAWAAGTPVVSSRTSGAQALVEEGQNGLLFDLDRPVEFHAAIDRLLADPERARRWGAAGRARVSADYDCAVLAGRMVRLYEELDDEIHAHRHSARR